MSEYETSDSTAILVFVPVRTSTPGNAREHWRVAGKKAKMQRQAAKWTLQGRKLPPFPVRVKLIRCSSGKLDRHNLPGALKHVIDGVADAYGVDDGDPRWVFEFDQEKSKLVGVRVEIESK